MSQFFALVRALFKSRYRFDKRKGKFDPMWFLYGAIGVLYLIMVAGICGLIGSYTPAYIENGLLPYMVLSIYILVMLAVLIFGVVSMLTYVYINRDAEFLAGLPVPGWKLFLAKLFMVYIGELALSVGSVLPIGITIGIAGGIYAGGFGFAYYLSVMLAVLFVPAVPLLLAALISIPLMYCVSFFKNKGAMTSIVVIILVAAVIVVYYFAIFKFQLAGSGLTDPEYEEAVANLIASIEAAKYVVYPVFALVEFGLAMPVFGIKGAGGQALALVIALGSLAAIIALAGFIANLVYSKSAAAQLENKSGRSQKAIEYRSQSMMRTLVGKEWRTLIRETAFAFQCLMGVILGPVFVVFIAAGFKNTFFASIETALATSGATLTEEVKYAVLSGLIISIIVMIVSGMNITAATAVSREGRNFYQMKIMPVPYKQQIKAKLYMSLLISVPASIVAFVIGAFMIPIPPWEALLDGLFLCVYAYLFACFALRIDLMRPKLNWVTPTQAVKNNRSSTMPVLLNMLTSVVIALILILVGSLSGNTIIAIAVLLAISCAAVPFLHNWLFKSVDKLFEEIEP